MIFHFAHLNSSAGLISSFLFGENPDFKANCLGSCSVPFAFDAFQNFTVDTQNSGQFSSLLSNPAQPTTANSQQSSNGSNQDNNGSTVGNSAVTGYISNTCLECNSLNSKSLNMSDQSGNSIFSISSLPLSKI